MRTLVFAAVALCACESAPTTTVITPTPVPTATAPSCPQTTLLTGAVPFASKTVGFTSLFAKAAGRLDLTLDWTHAENTMAIAVVDGACNPDYFVAGRCRVLLKVTPPPKPVKGSVAVAAGEYSLAIQNDGRLEDRITYTAILSDKTCPLP